MKVLKMKIATTLLIVVGVIGSHSVFATEPAHGGHGDGPAKKHFLGAFVGVYDGEETDMALGIEYEYKINSHWGIGAVYEDVDDAHHGDGISSAIGAIYFRSISSIKTLSTWSRVCPRPRTTTTFSLLYVSSTFLA